MIRAILFDYSGVFTTFPFVTLDAELLEVFWGDYGESEGTHPWHQLERGEITLPDFLSGLGDRARVALGEEFDLSVYFDALREGFAVYWPVVHRARQLSSDYRLALLTNNVKEFGQAWRGTIPVAELFELVVDSSEIGARKPEPRYFRHALDALGVEPGEAVFLDDMLTNVVGARAAGLEAIHVTDPVAALGELDRLLNLSRTQRAGESSA